MEELIDLMGCSVDSGAFAASSHLEHELVMRLTTFTVLHGQLRDRLRRCSESFTLTGALHEMHEDVAEKETFRVMSALSGGVLGAACGGICGGVGGALGAVGVVTYYSFCDDINAVCATFGFLGSVLGGAVGGASCGAIGGAVGASAAARVNSIRGGVSDFLWISFGYIATGGAIGGVFGGRVGAAGGRVMAALSAHFAP
ncbi:hypothetical protein L3Q82_000953 [Scortum barcoo]|uniref:Uncharacterized protein n=1 Tax=Scortum barcoo TaxID=214431 RepID=A0ACB8WB02_9TELE|nr:hypothetical protein L3Q82_000953 [Scortum barcoo]